MGSVMPSSRYLVSALLSGINWQKTAVIVELGAGTGAVTESIVKQHLADTLFICFEFDQELHQRLANRFPETEMAYDAFKLLPSLKKHNKTQSNYIVSSLPFANFSKTDQQVLLEQIKEALAADGQLILYQYSKQLEPLLAKHFQKLDRRYVWQNIPPAYVYHCSN